ncbi:MAG TPA: prepilin-type N-terminal cleavage/methylation domain-containing protein, partial [Gemmatimonadales bacterium]|nr:prepilin-type N-terminal cleavage/methylation domain-containing protein [Gemmatimonadales bacterium]
MFNSDTGSALRNHKVTGDLGGPSVRRYRGRCAFGVHTLEGVVAMNRKGFTLIELLIVVVIIGILAAIAIPKFANTKAKAYIASMKSDLRNLVTAEEAFF